VVLVGISAGISSISVVLVTNSNLVGISISISAGISSISVVLVGINADIIRVIAKKC
jgi:hypothetical protein